MGVGEGDGFSIGAVQVDSAVCGAHLLAAGARVHHGGGQLRVTGNESEKLISQNAINAYAPLGAFGLVVRGRRQNEILRCVSTAGSFTIRYINLLAGLAPLVCHLH